tara:strand:+ start:122 stop:319 length:198 start_codon:yes stop_codon:yes gene_type:complete
VTPALEAVFVKDRVGGVDDEKLAVTLLLLSMVTVQLPLPLQAPDQLLKEYPLAAVAVTVTWVPGS